MPSHWTYRDFAPASDLLQGDLIKRTDELLRVLADVHKFFCDARYIAFAVLTQSCDLVCRDGGHCKAEHINLAVVRELEPLLPRLLEEACGTGVRNVFRKESRYYAQQMLQKILNQNDQARGLFYLHPDADVGIATPSVIMIRVSIALRQEHYELLRKARSGQLRPEYANKLGWLSGNLYSRVATPDWEDQEHDRQASAKRARELLATITETDDENWVSQDWVDAARKAGLDLAAIPPTRFASAIKEYAPSDPIRSALNRVADVSTGVLAEVQAERIGGDVRRHANVVPQVIQQLVLLPSPLNEEEKAELSEMLHGDQVFQEAVRNHIVSIIRKKLKTLDAGGIDEICDAIRHEIGLIKPALKRVAVHVSALLADRQDEADVFVERVSAAELFSGGVEQTVRELAEPVVTAFAKDFIDRVVGRLRNDQAFKAAFRTAATQPINAALID